MSQPIPPYRAWASGRGDARFTDWLRDQAGPLWSAMTQHRFTHDMAADALPPGAFERYLRIEHAFVRQAVRIFAHALVQAPTPADQRHVTEILAGLTGEQERYFQEAYRRLGLPADHADGDDLPSAARALGEGALAVAADGGFEEILSMMLAAEWMYLDWCTAAHAAAPSRPEPAQWIALHVAPGFADGVAWTRARADALGPLLDPARQAACARHFRRMLELEIAFHDAVYDD